MKSEKENQPIDELFARKLGNLSLPPGADSFERLQARMNQRDQKVKMVIWRNPVVQRYMAVAACLLLICLFGWLYWSDAGKSEPQIAVRQMQQSVEKNISKPQNEANEAVVRINQSRLAEKSPTETIDKATEIVKNPVTKTHTALIKSEAQIAENSVRPTHAEVMEPKPVLTLAHPTDGSNSSRPANTNAVNLPTPEQLADNNPKANTPTERVLVVTIEEPAALAAARQGKNNTEEKVALKTNENDLKGNGIWQQVKRLKHGELFARTDNATNDDQGLLSRAYVGLKQSFDKGKSTKQ